MNRSITLARTTMMMLPIAMRMRDEGRQRFLVPRDNADEAAVANDLEVYPVRTMKQPILNETV